MSDTIIVEAVEETRGRPRIYHTNRAATGTETKRAFRAAQNSQRIENVAILDFETDPFDKETEELIYPFTACLYSDNFEPIVIWNEDFDTFIAELLVTLENLPDRYMIYAHNGGKFDYMFFVHKLRGQVSFKGRGIMSARIGRHELRDSFHILPERLSAFHKEEFDYEKMRKGRRNQHRTEIIEYMVSDCKYLLELVQGFIKRFGFKLSIGMAAMANLKRFYTVGKLGDLTDARLRQYFYGGRVECLAGKGWFRSSDRPDGYKIYDVNSMYSAAGSYFKHPVSASYSYNRHQGIGPNTVFVDVTCTNWGALVTRTENNETTAQKDYGSFRTTRYEFEAALELGLIENVNIDATIDNEELTDFSKHFVPLYEERAALTNRISELEASGGKHSPEWWEVHKERLYFKYLLNTGYGKFAQNPRRFKEWFITEPDATAPEGYGEDAKFRNEVCAMWARPAPRQSFNNVGTAASITGAARSMLMRAIHGAVDPIYCDTDSIICRKLNGVEIHRSKLGAWKLEREISEVIINGKKLYAYKYLDRDGQMAEPLIKSKGVSGVTWDDMVRMYNGEVLAFKNFAPTLTRDGNQFYMTRHIRATAPARDNRNASIPVSQRFRA